MIFTKFYFSMCSYLSNFNFNHDCKHIKYRTVSQCSLFLNFYIKLFSIKLEIEIFIITDTKNNGP